MSILVLTTGGTIGALSYADTKNPPRFVTVPSDGTDLVRDTLKTEGYSAFDTRCVSLEPRDSQNIDEAYLTNTTQLIAAAPENEILITIGTDGMVSAATFLHQQVQMNAALSNKTILLTGAMVPLANGPESDGYQNLVFALKQLTGFAMENSRQANGSVYIVLCDYEKPETESGAWAPRLYPFEPGRYMKIYTSDAHYNRLRRI